MNAPSQTQPDHVRAHEFCAHHRASVIRSGLCGCFYCRATFPPTEIHDWIDDDQTALCPRCGIDAVLGDEAGFPLTVDFLQQMHTYWFE